MHFKNNCWLAKITQVHISSKNGVNHLQKLIVQGLPTSTSQDNNSYRWWRMQFYEVLFRFWVIAEFYYSAATSAALPMFEDITPYICHNHHNHCVDCLKKI